MLWKTNRFGITMLWYRIGSSLLLAVCFFHLLGHFSGFSPENDTERQLFELMTSYTFQPINVTMMDLYKGFSLFFALFYLMTGVLNLWIVRRFRNDPAALRSPALLNMAGLSVGTAVSSVYFFTPPIVCIAMVLFCFTLSFVQLSPVKQ